jgi:phosphatidate cytidylyltransferase
VLQKRIITALWALALLFVSLYLGLPWFASLVALMSLIGSWEFYRLAGVGWPLLGLGLVFSALFAVRPLLPGDLVVGLIALAVGSSLAGLLTVKKPFHTWPPLLAGMFYPGWLLGYLVALMQVEWGWAALALFTTFACDTSAYFVGRALGHRPLAPAISPGKTWEGAEGGLLGAVLAAYLLDLLLGLPLSSIQAVYFGAGVGIIGQVGDLAESWLKRGAGAKDAGAILPGHGGVLDRMDSVAFTAPLVYYLMIGLF